MPGASLRTGYSATGIYDRGGGREGGAQQSRLFLHGACAHMSGILVHCASGSGYTPHPHQQPGLLRVADAAAAAAVYSSLVTSRNRHISPIMSQKDARIRNVHENELKTSKKATKH